MSPNLHNYYFAKIKTATLTETYTATTTIYSCALYVVFRSTFSTSAQDSKANDCDTFCDTTFQLLFIEGHYDNKSRAYRRY